MNWIVSLCASVSKQSTGNTKREKVLEVPELQTSCHEEKKNVTTESFVTGNKVLWIRVPSFLLRNP